MNRRTEIEMLLHELKAMAKSHESLTRKALLERLEFTMDSINERLHVLIQNEHPQVDFDGSISDNGTITFDKMEKILNAQNITTKEYQDKEDRPWEKAKVIPKKPRGAK